MYDDAAGPTEFSRPFSWGLLIISAVEAELAPVELSDAGPFTATDDALYVTVRHAQDV